MSNKLANLQSALKTSSGRTIVEAAPPAIPATAHELRKMSGQTASRAGKKNIAAWLPSDFKKSIRLVQAKLPGDPSLEDLMAEAFNDLFIKYNVPTIRQKS